MSAHFSLTPPTPHNSRQQSGGHERSTPLPRFIVEYLRTIFCTGGQPLRFGFRNRTQTASTLPLLTHSVGWWPSPQELSFPLASFLTCVDIVPIITAQSIKAILPMNSSSRSFSPILSLLVIFKIQDKSEKIWILRKWINFPRHSSMRPIIWHTQKVKIS